MIGTTLIQGEMVCPQIIVDNLCPHCDPILYKPRHSILSSWVFFWILKSKRMCFVILGHKMEPNVKMTPESPHEIRRRFLWANRIFFSEIFLPEVWAEVGRKSIDLSRPSKKYELGKLIHVTNFRYL